MQFNKLGLYFKTARYLTTRQVFFQLRYRFFRRAGRWRRDSLCHCKYPAVRAPFLVHRVASESDFLSHRYSFLNRTACVALCDGVDVDWEYSDLGGLWLDNLHYLRSWDALDTTEVRLKCEALLQWLTSWVTHVAANPGSKALNPPYNASERAFVLGRFLLKHKGSLSKSLSELIETVIGRDLNYIANTLEYHLDGNHLLKNLMSLAWGVCLFEGPDVEIWQSIVDNQLAPAFRTQVLDDGMHYERSPMYHNIALIDLLDIVNVAQNGPWRDYLLTTARKMMAASLLVTHPDGQIAQFNDAAFDPCPPSADVIAYGTALCGSVERPLALPTAGFYLLSCDENSYVIADAGPLGPDEQMGHAHSDLFSFEMSAFGHRLFVNSGTSTYYDQPFRQNERSERAHNTISFDNHQQCHHWSNFRAAERVRPKDIQWSWTSDGAMLSGTVELLGPPPRPKHTRTFRARHSGELLISDVVRDPGRGKIVGRLILAPEVGVRTFEPNCGAVWLDLPEGGAVQLSFSGALVSVDNCVIAQKFNERIGTTMLLFALNGKNATEIRSSITIKLTREANLADRAKSVQGAAPSWS